MTRYLHQQYSRYIALLLVSLAGTRALADFVYLNAVSGNGSTSGWVAGGATFGDDAAEPGGTVSTYTGKSPNRRLFVPIADTTIPHTVIYSVTVRVRARSNINLAGTYDGLKVGINLNGIVYLDPAIDEQDTLYLYYEHSWPRNPATSAAWTWADVNAIQGGCVTAKTAASQTTTYYVDHVQIAVEYGADTTNSPPTALEVTISGLDTVGEILTGSYIYSDPDNDPEGTSRFAWYRADDTLGTNLAAIAGATETVCVIPPVAENRYVFFEVTPVALSGVTLGLPVRSKAFGPIQPALGSAPVASTVTITGRPVVWETLVGAYEYSDADGDPEGESLIRWLRDGVAIPDATSLTYVVTPEDIGAMIMFEVTPVAASGSPRGGIAVRSAPIGPVEAPVRVRGGSSLRHSPSSDISFIADIRGRVLLRAHDPKTLRSSVMVLVVTRTKGATSSRLRILP